MGQSFIRYQYLPQCKRRERECKRFVFLNSFLFWDKVSLYNAGWFPILSFCFSLLGAEILGVEREHTTHIHTELWLHETHTHETHAHIHETHTHKAHTHETHAHTHETHTHETHTHTHRSFDPSWCWADETCLSSPLERRALATQSFRTVWAIQDPSKTVIKRKRSIGEKRKDLRHFHIWPNQTLQH